MFDHQRKYFSTTFPIVLIMGRRSSLPPFKFNRSTTWSQLSIVIGALLVLVQLSASQSMSDEYFGRELNSRHMRPSPITRIHRTSNGRLNSRFLRTFPPLDFLGFSRRNGEGNSNELVNGNSPVFYIRLPPAPYVLVPGLGYVSPHPYNTPMIGVPSPPVMMNPLGMMMGNGDGSSDEYSAENIQNNVISLPLKFLSNGRPAQIQNPKKKPSKNKNKDHIQSKTTHLISGGKYSFNGRPNGVFIVRSPVDGPSAPSS